jgi:2-haloalkanoic acid dehalogenase type II
VESQAADAGAEGLRVRRGGGRRDPPHRRGDGDCHRKGLLHPGVRALAADGARNRGRGSARREEEKLTYRYLTFDCYGTLIDWRAGIEGELVAALGDIGLRGQDLLNAYVAAEQKEEAGYKRYRQVLRDTALSLSGLLGTTVDGRSADLFASSVPKWPVYADTVKFLRDMGSRGFKRYILSNVDDDLLEETIRRNHLQVDGYVTAEQVGSYKPDPGHWKVFMARTGSKKGEILHVAQSLFHDILPTQKLGIDSAWVNRYGEKLPPVAAPAFIADSLERLAGILAEP